MKKNTKKKTLTAVTGATVIGVAVAALFNGSKLETVFNPDKFEKFDNKYKNILCSKQSIVIIMELVNWFKEN